MEIVCNSGLGDGYNVFFQAEFWNVKTFYRLLKLMKKSDRVWDRVLIQFVPHMYSPKGGLVPSLGLFSVLIKILFGHRLQVMFHELHYPFSFHWKSLVMWSCHHFMYLTTLWSAKEAFFSTQANFKKGSLYSLGADTIWLPVASNIPKGEVTQNEGEKLRVCLFGGLHVSKRYDLVFDVLNTHMEVHFVGQNREDLPLRLKNHPIVEHIIFHGKCDSHKTAEILGSCHLLIAYFSDGISSRRGSAMAALNQGIHLVTTFDWGSEDIFKFWPQVHLFPTDENAFKREVRAFFSKTSPQHFKRHSTDEFDQVFSWDAILNRYLKYCR